jgi:hypothetical protein
MEKVILDHVPLVTQAEDEFLETVMGKDLHDMEKDRDSSDFDQRFRLEFRLLTETFTLSTADDDDFHKQSFRYRDPSVFLKRNIPPLSL